jgi:acyl carrier protein
MGLDTVELVLAVEEHFRVEIPDEVASKTVTVGDLQLWLVNELQRQGRVPVDVERTFSELRELICKHAGVTPDRVIATARFVKDLHMD